MAAVKAAGADENTLAFFSSDNGNPEYGDMLGNLPLRGYKGEEGGSSHVCLPSLRVLECCNHCAQRHCN